MSEHGEDSDECWVLVFGCVYIELCLLICGCRKRYPFVFRAEQFLCSFSPLSSFPVYFYRLAGLSDLSAITTASTQVFTHNDHSIIIISKKYRTKDTP